MDRFVNSECSLGDKIVLLEVIEKSAEELSKQEEGAMPFIE